MPRVASADTALVAPQDREAGPSIEPAAVRLPRVLCVDDEPAILTMLERALRSEFEVVTQGDPMAALALVQHGGFSVVMSDMKMPGMTGSTFLERVKNLAPNSTRLALTAGLDWQLPPDVAFGILTKPCPLPLLQATVTAAAQCYALLVTPPPAAHRMPEAIPRASGLSAMMAGDPTAGTIARPATVESGLRPRGLELERGSSASALAARPSVQPMVVPHRLALALLGELIELWPRATLLGRAMDCDIVVRDERVAARHLRFFSSWRGVTVQDVSGKGGVRLNGEPLVSVRLVLPGDCIGLGAFDVYVQALDG
jgi:CheY-like chemotaxis protein